MGLGIDIVLGLGGLGLGSLVFRWLLARLLGFRGLSG